jgi:hypothetical protein
MIFVRLEVSLKVEAIEGYLSLKFVVVFSLISVSAH